MSLKTKPITRRLRLFDGIICAGFTLFLLFVIITSGMANVQTDAIDYYTVLQRLAQSDDAPLVDNLHFVEQRSPGYPLLAWLPYQIMANLLAPQVHTEPIHTTAQQADTAPSERMLIPPQPLLMRDLFFKDFYLPQHDSWFRWQISGAMLFTSYVFLFVGLGMTIKALALENRTVVGASLAPLVIVSSPIFMHNIVNTPSYATLTAFGLSGLFVYFFVKGSIDHTAVAQGLAGLFLGFLVLVRLETVVIALVLGLALLSQRDFKYLHHYVLGGLPAVGLLLAYNMSQFGTPFHLGILRGDINQLGFDLSYIVANLFHPQSGLLIWSALTSLGLVGLLFARRRYATMLGISALVLIILVLFRIPVMYHCLGEGTQLISGVPILCPATLAEARLLVRSDVNRYITVLVPLAVIGLPAGLTTVTNRVRRWRKKMD